MHNAFAFTSSCSWPINTPCKCPDGHMLIIKRQANPAKIWPWAALRDGQVLSARAPCCWCLPWSSWARTGRGRGCGVVRQARQGGRCCPRGSGHRAAHTTPKQRAARAARRSCCASNDHCIYISSLSPHVNCSVDHPSLLPSVNYLVPSISSSFLVFMDTHQSILYFHHS
jgi:hypothetical protein